jgi:hypothetical protein
MKFSDKDFNVEIFEGSFLCTSKHLSHTKTELFNETCVGIPSLQSMHILFDGIEIISDNSGDYEFIL